MSSAQRNGHRPFISSLIEIFGDAADHVEDDADRRRDQADGVVHDEQHAEVDRVDAGDLDHRHQHRRQDHHRRREVERGADDHDQISWITSISRILLPMNGSSIATICAGTSEVVMSQAETSAAAIRKTMIDVVLAAATSRPVASARSGSSR